MIKLIAFREIYAGFSHNVDYKMWEQLALAYGAEVQIIGDWNEAVIPDGHKIVLVESEGAEEITTFTHPENVVYVFGRTSLDIHGLIPHDCSNGECVRIDTPNPNGLFGVEAAAIVLHRR